MNLPVKICGGRYTGTMIAIVGGEHRYTDAYHRQVKENAVMAVVAIGKELRTFPIHQVELLNEP